MISGKVGGSSAKPEVSKQSKEKWLKHKVSGYKSQSKRQSIAGCRLLLRTLWFEIGSTPWDCRLAQKVFQFLFPRSTPPPPTFPLPKKEEKGWKLNTQFLAGTLCRGSMWITKKKKKERGNRNGTLHWFWLLNSIAYFLNIFFCDCLIINCVYLNLLLGFLEAYFSRLHVEYNIS